jgi:hypothetical protein
MRASVADQNALLAQIKAAQHEHHPLWHLQRRQGHRFRQVRFRRGLTRKP